MIELLEVGRVATYFSAHFDSECVIPIEPVNFECIFIKITLHVNKIIIFNSYRPPSAPSDSTMCILSPINSFNKHHGLIVLGEFDRSLLDHSSAKNVFNSVNLTQLIMESTRVYNCSLTLIDWILVC